VASAAPELRPKRPIGGVATVLIIIISQFGY